MAGSKATRFQPGRSGNPAGRPKGALNKSTLAARAILEANAARLFDKVVEMALAGSPTALKICTDRLLPRPHGNPIQVSLDTKKTTGADIFRSLSAVLQAVATGEITPQEGQNLSAIVDARRRAWESMELDERVSDIQDCADAHRNHRGRKVIWHDELEAKRAAQEKALADEADAAADEVAARDAAEEEAARKRGELESEDGPNSGEAESNDEEERENKDPGR